jgi:hypothetical protein
MQGLPPEESQRRQNLFAVFPLAVLRVMKEGRGKEFGVSGRVPMLAVSQSPLDDGAEARILKKAFHQAEMRIGRWPLQIASRQVEARAELQLERAVGRFGS